LDLGDPPTDTSRKIQPNTGGVKMRIIGIDLAVRSVHKAVVIDEGGHYLTRVVEFHTDVRDLAQLLGTARQGDPSGDL
jgi:hypothetical protein